MVSKGFLRGTHRICDPTETLRGLEPHLPRFGITRLADITGLDRINIPTVTAVRPAGLALGVSQGKGLSLAAAKASAIVEAIEGWAAERLTEPHRVCCASSLAGREAVTDVCRLPLKLGQTRPLTTPIAWVQGQDLMNEMAPIWTPLPLVHLDFASDELPGSELFVSSSNGLAGGNTLAEALIHALCELIERDAVAIWHWRGQEERDRTQISLEGDLGPDITRLLALLAQADMDLALFDCTSDIGIPAVHAEISERVDRLPAFFPRRFGGDGCHLDSEVAVLRAITEAAQSRLTFISGARDDLELSGYPAEDAEPPRLPARSKRPFDAMPSLASITFEDDLQLVLSRLKAIGIDQVAMIELPLPQNVPLSVIRLVVPGLEGKYRPRYIRPGPRALSRMFAQYVGSSLSPAT
ncbi:MAG: YcaO-like family protein [Geminicoccaceae bacterium]